MRSVPSEQSMRSMPNGQSMHRWYFHSAGAAHASADGGTLSPVAPTMEPEDSFASGALVHAQVLRYSSPSLLAPARTRAPWTVHVYTAASSLDADLVVRILDVATDGTAAEVASSAAAPLPLRPAHSGDTTHLIVVMGDGAHEFPTGHRVRIEIGAVNAGAVVAHHVYHDAVRASCLDVVMDGDAQPFGRNSP